MSSSTPVDIINIDLTSESMFTLKRYMIELARKQGVRLEISISDILSQESASIFYRGLNCLNRFLNQKDILVTSGATSALKCRSPIELEVISNTFGMGKTEKKILMGENVIDSLYKSVAKRTGIISSSTSMI